MRTLNMICDGIYYVGASDMRLARFENLFPVPDGVSYNSYLIADDKTAVIDCVDGSVQEDFLANVCCALDGRELDYIVIQHIEPDHSASIVRLADAYPTARLVMNARAAAIFTNFFGDALKDRIITVNDGEELSLGRRTLKFVFAPMVHWPEVMVSYLKEDEILFSADAFGSFGAVGGNIFDNDIVFETYSDEMRRYYSNIVGKYGPQVGQLLDKASSLAISAICPLHGRVLKFHIGEALEKYRKWASYTPESDGVLIAYSSMYGNTKRAAFALADEFTSLKIEVKVSDVSSSDVSYLVSDAFKYRRLVLASVTYNGGIYPKTEAFISDLKALGLKRRVIGFVENGSWAPMSAKLMRAAAAELKDCVFSDFTLTLHSSFKLSDQPALKEFAVKLLSLKADE